MWKGINTSSNNNNHFIGFKMRNIILIKKKKKKRKGDYLFENTSTLNNIISKFNYPI